MNNVIAALCGTVNFMPPWIMLGVFGAIILLIAIIIALKGVKRKFFRVLVYVLAGLIPTSYLVYLAVQVILWENVTEQIAFAIAWLPTVLFVLIVLIATLRGLRRGLRKSIILALHATCAGALCVAFFFIMVGVEDVDAGSLNFVNLLMGGEGSLQRALGVSEECATLKGVLAEYICVTAGIDGITPYVYTLVDMAYRIIFAVISLLIFFTVDFVLYIVYVLCYSQRKYKKNRILEFKNGKTDKNYKKHTLGGGLVGLVRGVAVGLLSLSFLGSAFYVVAGGKGEGKLEDYDFGNDDINFFYEIYRSIEGYGSQGIFKILNAVSDATDTPYYLFAADLIFSGELNDEEFDVHGNVKFREELALFTGFARETLGLLMKYGSDELNAVVGGDVTDNAFDTVVRVMTKTGFKEEFDLLIDDFDEQSYVINLSMSFVSAIVNRIDELSFTKDNIGEGERELIKLIFKKGFLTENIPDERDLIEETGKTEAEGNNIRPYLTVKHIITKNDVKVVLNVVLSVLAGNETGDTLQLVKRIVPEIEKLSILSSERKAEFNPVLGRMYCLFENLYLTADGEDGVTYSEINADGIDWIGEINGLLDVVDDVTLLYDNLSSIEGEALDIVKILFNEENANYQENMRAYDGICRLLTESRVMGRALSTHFVYKTIYDGLTGLSENVYIPDKINFSNAYDKHGNVVSYGETYQLLYGVKLLFGGDNAKIIDTLLNVDGDTPIEEILNVLAQAVEPDENGNTNPLVKHLTDSVILRSVISIELLEVGGNTLYVPKAALEEVDNTRVNLITKRELSGLLENMTKLVDFVMPFMDEENPEAWKTEIDNFLINNNDFYALVQDNRIFEGTVARMFTEKIKEYGTSIITVPIDLDGFDNIDGWITVDGKQGELLYLLDALRYTQFKISDVLLDAVESTSIIKKICNMNEGELDTFFASRVLHYTVSHYILDDGASVGDGFILVIPKNSREYLEFDSIESLIKKRELVALFTEISALGLYEEEESPAEPPEENPDGGDNAGGNTGDGGETSAEPPAENNGGHTVIEKILARIAEDKSILERSSIIPASIVATLVNDEELATRTLVIPELFDKYHMGATEQLEQYDSTNPWKAELPALIDALDEVLGISDPETDFTFDGVDVSEKISALLTSLNDISSVNASQTKLQVMYSSEIFRSKITAEIDETFKDKNVVDSTVLSYVKQLDGYYKVSELQALSNAVNVLGVTDFNDLTSFDDYKANLTVDTLGEVYKSVIAQGIISKAVTDIIEGPDNKTLVDHPLARRTELRAVYRESEIHAVLTLYNDLELGDVEKIDLQQVSGLIYDGESGEVKSYLLVASLSEQLIDHPGLIIPDGVVETVAGKKYVTPLELSRLVDAFNAMKPYIKNSDGSAIEDINGIKAEDMQIDVPEDTSVRGEIFQSEIMRARITYQLITLNRSKGGVLAVGEGKADAVLDVRASHSVGETYVINAEQLEALAAALLAIGGGEASFEVPAFDVGTIITLSDKIDVLCVSDALRYKICEVLSSEGAKYGVVFGTEPVTDLTGGGITEYYTASDEDIRNAAQLIQSLS